MDVADRSKGAKEVAAISLVTNVTLTVAKGAVGFMAGSTAVVADAAHSASDILATAIVFVGLRIGGTPPDETHHYGHARFESVAAKIVALILIVTGLGLGINAFNVLRGGEAEVPGGLAIWITMVSIVAKEWLYRYVHGVGNRLGSTALQAEAWHHRSDAISSVAALIGVIGAYLGYPFFDPLAGLAVSALIVQMGGKLYVQSVRELIDEAPTEEVVSEIKKTADSTLGVISVTEVKARNVGPSVLVDLKICVNKFLTVEQGHNIASRAKRRILEDIPQVDNVLVHVNPCHHVQSVEEVPDCKACGDHPPKQGEEVYDNDASNRGPRIRGADR